MHQDILIPFLLDKTGIRGKITRLNNSLNDILHTKAYPRFIQTLLAELSIIATLMGDNLKNHGSVSIEIKTQGIISLLVADYNYTQDIRACAEYDKESFSENLSFEELFDQGYIAVTITYDKFTTPYQGIIPLDKSSITECIKDYFNNSEQLNTNIITFLGEELDITSSTNYKFVGGGIMLQALPDNNKDSWNEANILANTLKADEILDQNLSLEQILYMLFNEIGVIAYQSKNISFKCKCSRERADNLIRSFPLDEIISLADEDGNISMTCGFCNATQIFHTSEYVKH